MTNTAKQIFTNQTTNGNSLTFSTNGHTSIKINGTFNGATIEIQSKTNNSNDIFSSTGDTPITQDEQISINYTPSMQYRLVLNNSGASTNINAFVTG